MTRPVQTGDLAIIVRAAFPENIGAVVEVGPWLLPGARVNGLLVTKPCFLVHSKGRLLAYGTRKYGVTGRAHSKVCARSRLVPILPDAGVDVTLTWKPVRQSIYMNPSTSGDGEPDVFVYEGPTPDPAHGDSLHFYTPVFVPQENPQ